METNGNTPYDDTICQSCNKKYSNRSGLWKHNNKYHGNNGFQKSSESQPTVSQKSASGQSKVSQKSVESNIEVISIQNNIEVHKKLYYCSKCDTVFKHKQSKWKHEQKCEITNDKIIEDLKTEVTEMRNQIATLLNEKAKIHPNTLKKINRQLSNNTNNGTINNGTINNNTNNGTVINNTYVKFGRVDISKVLSQNEIKHILDRPFCSIEETIKKVHFSEKRPEYNNMFITNMKDDLIYVFDGKNFSACKKDDVVSELIDFYADEIETSVDKNKDKLSEFKLRRLNAFSELINSDAKYKDIYNKIHSSYRVYKYGDIKRLIYNNSDSKKLNQLNKMELKEQIIEDNLSEDE